MTAAISLPLGIDGIAKAIGIPRERWHGQCHAVSLAIVKSGLIEGGRVARGWCQGVPGQHSWIAVRDCYDPEATIVDPTLWTYRRDVSGILVTKIANGLHTPHGYGGSIWTWGQPRHGGGKTIKIPTKGLSREACSFLRMLGPLDSLGWGSLFTHAPVAGWPAGEIMAAAAKVPRLDALIPIDRLGMLTDLNPGGLYR